MKVSEIETIPDLVTYWRECLLLRSEKGDSIVAGYIVNVVSNDVFQAIYDEGRGDANVCALYDIAADLEVPLEREVPRKVAWERIDELIRSLEIRYLH